MEISDKEILVDELEEHLRQVHICTLGNAFVNLSKNNFLQGFNKYMEMSGPGEILFLEGIDFSDNNNIEGKIGLRHADSNKVSFISFIELLTLT
jgi:hypothetical protein